MAQGTDLGRGPFGKAQRLWRGHLRGVGQRVLAAHAEGRFAAGKSASVDSRSFELSRGAGRRAERHPRRDAASPAPERDGGVLLATFGSGPGAAAVVAAGTVTLVVVLSKPTEPPRGDIDPGTVTAPLLRF